MYELDSIGIRSVFACPDCHGITWEINEGGLVRYRCHIGHAYTAELMSFALDENLRRALGSALRALEERVSLARHLEKQDNEASRTQSARSWGVKASEFQAEVDVIRESIHRAEMISARFVGA